MDKRETVFLTGGTGIIGKTLIDKLYQSGYNVCFTSRSFEKIKEIEQLYTNNTDPFVKGVVINLAEENVDTLQFFFKTNKIQIDILINNVRDLNNLRVKEDGTTERNFFLSEFILGAIVPYELSIWFSRNKFHNLKNIINISSMYGIVPPNGELYLDGYDNSPIQYGVSKASLIHLTKELAVRMASLGIRVNCVSYGGVEGRSDDEFKKRYARLTPMGRMLKPDEVANPVLFLVSHSSSGMTGHNLVYDGGYTIW